MAYMNETSCNDACFSQESWPHEVICPGLADTALVGRLSRRQFVDEVVRHIPAWARKVLKTSDTQIVEDTCQEFCRQMIEFRPDMAYLGSMAPKEAYLAVVLRYTHWRMLTKSMPLCTSDDIDFDLAEDERGGTAVMAEHRELIALLGDWAGELPESERAAMAETIASLPCNCPSKLVHRVRCSRALSRLRTRAQVAGLCEAEPISRSRRPSRSRPPRPANIRVVRRLAQRSGCASSQTVPECSDVT
jgi:hypothetical protein